MRRHQLDRLSQTVLGVHLHNRAVLIRLQRLPSIRIQSVLHRQIFALVTATVLHLLSASLIQLVLQRLNGLQIAHWIKLVRNIIITHHHKRMTKRIRHLNRSDQKTVLVAVQKSTDSVFTQIVKLPHFAKTFRVPVSHRSVRTIVVQPAVTDRALRFRAMRSNIARIDTDVSDRTPNPLRNPTGITQMAGVRINKHVKNRDAFNKRSFNIMIVRLVLHVAWNIGAVVNTIFRRRI